MDFRDRIDGEYGKGFYDTLKTMDEKFQKDAPHAPFWQQSRPHSVPPDPPADHHYLFGVLSRQDLHIQFPPQHRIDQALDVAFSKDRFNTGIAGNTGPYFIQAIFHRLVGHFRIRQQASADTNQVRLSGLDNFPGN